MSVTLLAADPTATVLTGPYVLAALLAVAAGAVSFASPCVIPLVPGYLSYLAALSGTETSEATARSAGTARAARSAGTARSGGGRTAGAVTATTTRVRGRVLGATALFVAGFTLVFLAQSALVLGLVDAVKLNSGWLMRIGGVVTIVMGLAMLGFVRPLQTERRVHARPTGRVFGAVLLGAFFGLGWTVCLGPTLQGVLALSYATDWGSAAWRGLSLVIFYCAGLGIPFLVMAFGFGWATSALGVLRRHARTIQVVGAVLLLAIGLAMVTGVWGQFVSLLQTRFPSSSTVI